MHNARRLDSDGHGHGDYFETRYCVPWPLNSADVIRLYFSLSSIFLFLFLNPNLLWVAFFTT